MTTEQKLDALLGRMKELEGYVPPEPGMYVRATLRCGHETLAVPDVAFGMEAMACPHCPENLDGTRKRWTAVDWVQTDMPWGGARKGRR